MQLFSKKPASLSELNIQNKLLELEGTEHKMKRIWFGNFKCFMTYNVCFSCITKKSFGAEFESKAEVLEDKINLDLSLINDH